MAISAAIFTAVMAIVGLFVTSKGAPLSNWTTLRDILMKTTPGKKLAVLLQKLIDLVCSMLGIGIYPGCIVEFKDVEEVVLEKGAYGKKLTTNTDEVPDTPKKGKDINVKTGATEYVVVEVHSNNLKLKVNNPKVLNMKNFKKKNIGVMLDRKTVANEADIKKPEDYALIPRDLMKKNGKLDKE